MRGVTWRNIAEHVGEAARKAAANLFWRGALPSLPAGAPCMPREKEEAAVSRNHRSASACSAENTYPRGGMRMRRAFLRARIRRHAFSSAVIIARRRRK